ncbi:hypothetical protein ACHAW6_012507 [Cyclotella cf. meneghiniana]
MPNHAPDKRRCFQPPSHAFLRRNDFASHHLSLYHDPSEDHDDNQSQSQSQTNYHKAEPAIEHGFLSPSLVISAACMVSIASSLVTLWSEYSIITTGCGPPQLSDLVERGCYLGTLVIAGLSVFTRIVTGLDVATTMKDYVNDGLKKNSRDGIDHFNFLQIQLAESMSLSVVFGAFLALGIQQYNGEKMDGLSGINVDMCRALQSLRD